MHGMRPSPCALKPAPLRAAGAADARPLRHTSAPFLCCVRGLGPSAAAALPPAASSASALSARAFQASARLRSQSTRRCTALLVASSGTCAEGEGEGRVGLGLLGEVC